MSPKEQYSQPPRFDPTPYNMKLIEMIRGSIILGTGRLKEPLYKNEIKIIDVINAVVNQSCIRVKNYEPDKKNKHLRDISLGPSYLESQLSRAIDELTKQYIDGKGGMDQQQANYLRGIIGLSERRKEKPQQQQLQRIPMQRRESFNIKLNEVFKLMYE